MMFRLYWWLVACGIGSCLLYLSNNTMLALASVCGIAVSIYVASPETTLQGKFDGGYKNE